MRTLRLLMTVVLCGLVACGAAEGPASLAGTSVDGHFNVDDAGALVLDEDARRVFDYVLLAEDELTPEALEAWYWDELLQLGLDDALIEEGWAGFSAYRRYRDRASVVLADEARPVDAARAELALILDEELGDSPLAQAERARLRRAFELRAALDLEDPEARREAVRAVAAPPQVDSDAARFVDAAQALQAAERRGASEPELKALRRTHFAEYGPEALQRLDAVAAQRDDFRARVATLAADMQAASVELEHPRAQAWVAERFTADERRRVRGALARHHALAR